MLGALDQASLEPKEPSEKLRPYTKLSASKKAKLLAIIDSKKMSMKDAAIQFGVSYSTAKIICKKERQRRLQFQIQSAHREVETAEESTSSTNCW